MDNINPFERKALDQQSSNVGTPHKGTPLKMKGTPRRGGDRFIPSRGAMDLDVSHFNLVKENVEDTLLGNTSDEYEKSLSKNLLGDACDTEAAGSQVLAFKKKAPAPAEGYQNELRVLYTANRPAQAKKTKSTWYISNTPERILDAPDLLDDYYLNLLDWSDQSVLGIALAHTVYLWDAADGSITQLCDLPEEANNVTSVQWGAEGS